MTLVRVRLQEVISISTDFLQTRGRRLTYRLMKDIIESLPKASGPWKGDHALVSFADNMLLVLIPWRRIEGPCYLERPARDELRISGP